MQQSAQIYGLSDTAERREVVLFCARFTRDLGAAEDLAQQTLLAAWRHERELRDPGARRAWLFRIAHNTCVTWARTRNREASRLVDTGRTDEPTPDPGEWLPDGVDLERDIERTELAELLDRAMALLPPETRCALVERYVEESPQAEVAERLGLSEGAVEARLYRGKLALRRILATELRDEALSYGLIPPSADTENQTRIWCPYCGRHRLQGTFDPDAGELRLRCPSCARPGANNVNADLAGNLGEVKGYKPALTRVLAHIHDLFGHRAGAESTHCSACGNPVPIRTGIPFWLPTGLASPDGVYTWCAGCRVGDGEDLRSLTLCLPEARRFWRENPRMRYMPERPVEADGQPAVATGFESVTGGARLEVVVSLATRRVLRVRGAPAE